MFTCSILDCLPSFLTQCQGGQPTENCFKKTFENESGHVPKNSHGVRNVTCDEVESMDIRINSQGD